MVDTLRTAYVSLPRQSHRGSDTQVGAFRIDLGNDMSLREPVLVTFHVLLLGP